MTVLTAPTRREALEAPTLRPASVCSRCGKAGHLHVFPPVLNRRGGDLCGDCRAEWDHLLAELVERWQAGLRICFFCRRPLGDERFPAKSPFGASCAECGLKISTLVVASP